MRSMKRLEEEVSRKGSVEILLSLMMLRSLAAHDGSSWPAGGCRFAGVTGIPKLDDEGFDAGHFVVSVSDVCDFYLCSLLNGELVLQQWWACLVCCWVHVSVVEFDRGLLVGPPLSVQTLPVQVETNFVAHPQSPVQCQSR